jgi:hypothetical protein
MSNTLPRPARRQPHRAVWLAGIAFLAAGATGVTIGCSGGAPAPERRAEPFAGPAVRIDRQDRQAIVILTAPSPGYQPVLTQTLPAEGRQDVFITVRRPNPALSHAQVLVEHRIATGVPSDREVWVYARLVPFDAPKEGSGPYSLAARSTDAPAADPGSDRP